MLHRGCAGDAEWVDCLSVQRALEDEESREPVDLVERKLADGLGDLDQDVGRDEGPTAAAEREVIVRGDDPATAIVRDDDGTFVLVAVGRALDADLDGLAPGEAGLGVGRQVEDRAAHEQARSIHGDDPDAVWRRVAGWAVAEEGDVAVVGDARRRERGVVDERDHAVRQRLGEPQIGGIDGDVAVGVRCGTRLARDCHRRLGHDG